MLPKKRLILSATTVALLWVGITLAIAIETKPARLYEYSDGGISYLENVDTYCGKIPQNLVGELMWAIPAAVKEKPYPNLDNLLLRAQSRSDASWIAAASEIHVERMNAIYACGVINAKRRALETVEASIKEVHSSNAANVSERLKEMKTRLDSGYTDQKCSVLLPQAQSQETDPQKKAEADWKLKEKEVLDAAAFELCRYQYYLLYLQANAEQNASKIIAAQGGSGTVITVNKAANTIISAQQQIQGEMQRSRKVHEIAFTSLLELQKSYASHVLLLLIREDYEGLRAEMDIVMNNISQTMYKASNATNNYDK